MEPQVSATELGSAMAIAIAFVRVLEAMVKKGYYSVTGKPNGVESQKERQAILEAIREHSRMASVRDDKMLEGIVKMAEMHATESRLDVERWTSFRAALSVLLDRTGGYDVGGGLNPRERR